MKDTWKEMKGKSKEMKWNEKETRLTKHIHDINFAKTWLAIGPPPKTDNIKKRTGPTQ